MDYGDKPAAAKWSLLTPPRWSLFAPPLTWVFWKDDGDRYRNVSALYAKLRERAKVSIRFHDLRHKYARDFLRGDGNIYELQKQLGHSSVKTTEMYLFNLTDDQHEEVAKVTAKIGNRSNGSGPSRDDPKDP